MRDHTKLRAFEIADELVLAVYIATRDFPSDERFGIVQQLRRSAMSAASNIVEGCARRTEADYLHFLDMAHGSARELEYQLSVTIRLGLLRPDTDLLDRSIELSKVLNGLIQSLRS